MFEFRAISGPPTRTSIGLGTIRATDQNAMLTSELNSFMNAPIPTLQAVPGSHSAAAPGTTATAGCGRNL